MKWNSFRFGAFLFDWLPCTIECGLTHYNNTSKTYFNFAVKWVACMCESKCFARVAYVFMYNVHINCIHSPQRISVEKMRMHSGVDSTYDCTQELSQFVKCNATF